MWVHGWVVGMEYEIYGMTGAGKLVLYCKFSLTRQTFPFRG
jgi:hypothetical protein